MKKWSLKNFGLGLNPSLMDPTDPAVLDGYIPSTSLFFNTDVCVLLKQSCPFGPTKCLCCRCAGGCLGHQCSSSKVSFVSPKGAGPHEGPVPLTAWSQRTELTPTPPLGKTILIPVFHMCVEWRRVFWEPCFGQEPSV